MYLKVGFELHKLFIAARDEEGMIIGVTGPIASGKSVLAELLMAKGFLRLTLSEEVREEAKKRGLPIERRALQDLGNQLRKEFGKGYWAERLLIKMQPGKNYVIEGIRNPGEVETLRKLPSFILIGISAPVEDRLEWILARNKDSDPKTREGILAIDARDRGVGEGSEGQQSDACYALADFYILNNTTLEDLREKVAQVVQELGC